MLPGGVGLAQQRVGMEQEHKAEAVESGKVNSWRWQPGARLNTFGISCSKLIFTTSSVSEICSLLPKMMDMQEMVFPLTYTVTMLSVLQQLSSCLFFFCFALLIMNWIISHFPGRPHYLGCWYLSSPCCQSWLVLKLGLVSPPVPHTNWRGVWALSRQCFHMLKVWWSTALPSRSGCDDT